jgi:hypothetical protein
VIKKSMHLMITIPPQLMIWGWPSQNTLGTWTVLYWTRSSRTQFGLSISVWRLAEDTLNITCNFLYCNHQVHRDFLITLYYQSSCSTSYPLSTWRDGRKLSKVGRKWEKERKEGGNRSQSKHQGFLYLRVCVLTIDLAVRP